MNAFGSYAKLSAKDAKYAKRVFAQLPLSFAYFAYFASFADHSRSSGAFA